MAIAYVPRGDLSLQLDRYASVVNQSPIAWVLLALFFIGFIVTIIVRTRRGGPGPAVYWIPRRFRPAVNDLWGKRGWPLPFDGQGRRIRPLGRRRSGLAD